MPNRLGSFACGIRNVLVAALGAPALRKSVLWQEVAAMLGRARTGLVPTHGRLTRPTTGRSAAARVPRASPDGGGSTGAARTDAGQGPEGSVSQRLRTALVSAMTARLISTGRPFSVSVTVET